MYIKFNPRKTLPILLLATSSLASPALRHRQTTQHTLSDSTIPQDIHLDIVEQSPTSGVPLSDLIALHSKKPKITPSGLSSQIKLSALLSRARDFYKIAQISAAEYNHPTRVIGSLGHLGTTNYIIQVLNTLGGYYNVSTQYFDAVSGNVFESRLVLDHEVLHASPMGLTPPTPHREPVFANLSAAKGDGCDESDFEGQGVNGTIVLIKRGKCPFGTKSSNAGKAGAVAAVVYNNEPGSLSGTLGQPEKHHIATFGISKEDGEKFLERLDKGKKIDGSAYIDSIVETIVTRNVIAQSILGDQQNCVMLGGHSDSVEEGPGINDDGSGSITVLEVAVQLAKFSLTNCVRFAWWSGEEEGLLGSTYYAEHLTEDENLSTRLFMDYDMLASPNFAYQIYNATDERDPKGSGELKELYIDLYERLGVNYTFIPFDGRSDYVGFIDAGIPAGGIATGAEGVKTEEEVELFGGVAGEWYDKCYHQLCDDLTNLSEEAWEVNGKLVAESVGTFAETFDGFPKREKESVGVAAMKERKESGEKRWKWRGGKLVM